ncbi:MAG: hypothetical protein KDA21_08810, partial [Phycisphaerales bacterium]|nr:hypothetical protein [Phycisphaerales bacterium]
RDRPLRLFQEAAHWGQLAASHATWYDVQDELNKVEGDWNTRWGMEFLRDPLHRKVTDWQKCDKQAYAMFEPVLDPIENLFWMRLVFYAHIGGTRTALGLAAFRNDNGEIPLTSKAIQPRYRRNLDTDPFTWQGRARTEGALQAPNDGRELPFGFFVPIRDVNWGPRDIPAPHTMTVYSYYLDPLILLANVRYTTFPNMLEGGPTGPEVVASANAGAGQMLSMLGLSPDMIVQKVKQVTEGVEIDWTTLDADLSTIRSRSIAAINKAEVSPERIEALTRDRTNARGLKIDTREKRYEFSMMLWNRQFIPLIRAMKFPEATGITISKIDAFARLYSNAAADDADLISYFEAFNGERPFTAEDSRRLRRLSVNVVFSEPVWAEVQKMYATLKEGPMGPIVSEMIKELQSGTLDIELPTSFPFTIDDSNFILYSVGWDGVGERAATVHPLKGDILIWPPVLSLTKLSLQGVNTLEDDEE